MDVAEQIQRLIGGKIHHVTPGWGAEFLGGFQGHQPRWRFHRVVVKEGRAFDAFTGYEGLPVDEYKALWEFPDGIDFGF